MQAASTSQANRRPGRIAPAGRFVALLVLAAVAPSVASAQLLEDLPAEMQDVGIDDKSGTQIPLGLRFRDENGEAISLADVFDGDRPVLLSLNYSDCPLLCTLQLSGLVTALRDVDWKAGNEYVVVSVSVDPLETTVRAKQTEQRYLKQYDRPGAADGFRFLTGSQKNIRALADAVGFRYKYVPDTKEYSHTATEIVCTPDGVVSRYLNGVAYEPQTVRLSLVEAGDGKIGSTFDQLLMYCFHYDETKGRYAPTARKIMSLGAGVTIFALVVGLVPYWMYRGAAADIAAREAAAEKANAEAETNPTTPVPPVAAATETDPIEVA